MMSRSPAMSLGINGSVVICSRPYHASPNIGSLNCSLVTHSNLLQVVLTAVFNYPPSDIYD